MLPEEKARVKIDKQLRNAGWDIISRNEYLPNSTTAVKEALMVGNTESDYLLFVDGKAIAVVEAKREENPLGEKKLSEVREGDDREYLKGERDIHEASLDLQRRVRKVVL